MSRLRFTKEGPAIWSSHLDLMRALMRCFRRAGVSLKHSQGYTPHPELSILMPLSVGVESCCELAEFTLAEDCKLPIETLAARMAPIMPAGLVALESYDGGLKAGKLAWLRASLSLYYDRGIPAAAEDSLRALFARSSLVVEKHSKKGPVELDIAPMIRELRLTGPAALPPQGATDLEALPEAAAPDSVLTLEALVAAQNPTLNPLLLAAAIETHLPACKPDFVRCRRLELYDEEMNVFR